MKITGREPGVVISHGYFDDVIARVMGKLDYTMYKVSVGNESNSYPPLADDN